MASLGKAALTDPGPLVHDSTRLAALIATGLLDSDPEDCFDRMTTLAAKLTNSPVSYFSLIDRDREFHKSSSGFPKELEDAMQVTGRTFCQYTLLNDEPLVVNNVLGHDVLRSLPAVEQFGVIAYLGIPLRLSSGESIGAFCVVDRVERDWSQQDISLLQEFAAATMREIELRSAAHALEQLRHDREKLVNIIMHDLRNPVTNIALSLDLLNDSTLKSEERELLMTIKRSNDRMVAAIDHVIGTG